MNSLLWYMRQYYIASCEANSFHANVVKQLYSLAKDFGNDESRKDLGYLAKFAEQTCHWVYSHKGVDYLFYWFFCILIDADGVYSYERETMCSKTPDELFKYLQEIGILNAD